MEIISSMTRKRVDKIFLQCIKQLFFKKYLIFRSQLTNNIVDSGYLRQKLLEYVSDGNLEMITHMQDAEIGQRIYSAMEKVSYGLVNN